jgi:hypothetical protein
MPALDFPSAPLVGDRYPFPAVLGIPTYTWDGEKWTTSGPGIITSGGAAAPPLPDGAVAIVGASNKFAREDHVHPETIVLPVAATAAQFLANAAGDQGKMLTPGAAWAAAATLALTPSAGVCTPNMSLSYNFSWVIGGAGLSLGAPSNMKLGQAGIIVLQQDGTGSRIITFDPIYKFPNAVDPTLSTAANATDIISYFTFSPTAVLCSFQRNLA